MCIVKQSFLHDKLVFTLRIGNNHANFAYFLVLWFISLVVYIFWFGCRGMFFFFLLYKVHPILRLIGNLTAI